MSRGCSMISFRGSIVVFALVTAGFAATTKDEPRTCTDANCPVSSDIANGFVQRKSEVEKMGKDSSEGLFEEVDVHAQVLGRAKGAHGPHCPHGPHRPGHAIAEDAHGPWAQAPLQLCMFRLACVIS